MLSFFKTHSIYFILALAAVFCFAWLMSKREKLRMNWVAAIILSILEVAFALVYAKLFAKLEGGGNMSLYGGLFFLPITYIIGALITRRRIRDVVDVFAVCTLITVFFARLNCLIAGCCLGKVIGETAYRWPHREVELILYAVLLEIFIYRCSKKKNHGELYPIYMISYGTLRFITEFLRESDQIGVFHRAHYWSIICVVIGVAALIYINIKHRKEV